MNAPELKIVTETKPKRQRKPKAVVLPVVEAPKKAIVQPARIAMACVVLIGLAVSLTDLSDGIALLAGVTAWKAIALALTFDMFVIADEYLMLTCELPKDGKLAAEGLLGLVSLWSAYLNALAFSGGHYDMDHLVQISMGISLTGMIVLATFAAARAK